MDPADVLSRLQNRAIKRTRPDGSFYQALLFEDESALAGETGYSRRRLQILALEQGIVPERYIRNQASLKSEDQLALLQSRVAIIGLGGLGGAVTEILARVGIGALTLVDGDRFEDSNLNRQLLSSVDVLGRLKAEVAAERVAAINPAIELRLVSEFLSRENGRDLLREAALAVDCLDTIPGRFVLQEACRTCSIPFVSAAVGGRSGQVMVIFPEDDGLSRIYGDPRKASRTGVEQKRGTLPYTAVAMAAVQCAEVVTLAIGRPARLRNRLFLADLADHDTELIDFS